MNPVIKSMSLLFLAAAISSCSKDDGNETPAPAPAPVPESISSPPSSYTKKVLLEYHTAAWCGTCPDAEIKRQQVMDNYPNRLIPVAVHQSDAMQTPLFMTLDATFGSNPAYGMINRIPTLGNVLLNRTQWLSNATPQMNGVAKCGLAILSKVSGSSASIEVQASFRETLSGDHRLTVYLVEHEVTGTGTGYDQVNTYNNDPSSPYYNRGNPIAGYKHPYVVRKVLTANLGDAIESSKTVSGGLLKKTFTADITGMDKTKTYVIAFVNKAGTSSTTHEVLNAQMALVGKLKDWD